MILFFSAFFGCSDSTNTEIKALKKQTADLQRQIDSLKTATTQSAIIQADTVYQNRAPVNTKQPAGNTEGRLRAGKHNFTLQWISWDEPGSVTLQPSENGWYSIEGEQKNRRNNDYITIKGVIRQISATDLEFKGEITSVVETINAGKPCTRTGTKVFKTTKNRKYWRLQDMINCEGGLVTDYVDIYF